MRLKNERVILVLLIMISLLLVGCGNKTSSAGEEFSLENTMNQFVSIDEATLLQPDETDEFWAVTEKMTTAMGQDSEWSTEFRKENKYYPYVYDEKLGLTEEEYNNLFVNGKYIIFNEIDSQAFSCETYDDNSFSMYFPEIDLGFSIDIEQNIITLNDGTVLSFAKSVDLNESENILGDWVGSTFSYLDVKSNQTNKELYELGIRDEVFDIGHENRIAPIQASINGELDCRFVAVTIGKYKGLDEYVVYFRHLDITEEISEYYVYKFSKM